MSMTDLTDRMRTCAAHIVAHDAHEREDGAGLVLRDAADLLIEASNALEACVATGEACVPLGEPMSILPMVEQKPVVPLTSQQALDAAWTDMKPQGTWIDPGGTLPQPRGKFNPRACPQCDSRATKRVRREGNKLMLECPVCAAKWEWKRSNPT
jgi:hypothetical protein